MSESSDIVDDTSSFTSYFTLFVFIITIIGILFCINKDIKLHVKTKTIRITYLYPPLIGCLFLLLTVSMTPMDMITAIIGEGTVKPYTIILLVISISLVCISLDFTGAISYISWKLISLFATTRLRLFTLIYVISTCFSILTSNDVVVMTMTPLVMYCAEFANIKPLPYLIASFYAANLSGMFFVTGNPTNWIIAQAMGLKFTDYLIYMAIPAVCCMVIGFICLVVVSRHELGLNMEDLIPIPIVQYWLHRYSKWKEHREQTKLSNGIPSDTSSSSSSPSPSSQFSLSPHHDINTDLDGLNSDHINTATQQSLSFIPPSESFQFPGTKPVDAELIAMDNGHIGPRLTHTDSKYIKVERTRIVLPNHNADDELRDSFGAIYQGGLLLLCLITMAVSSFAYDKIEIWMVSCGCCVLSFIYDVIRYPLMPQLRSDNLVLGETTIIDQQSNEKPTPKKRSALAQSPQLSDANHDSDSNHESINSHRGTYSPSNAMAIFAKKQPTPTANGKDSLSSPPLLLPTQSQEHNLFSIPISQSPLSLSSSSPVDPFAISLEAVDDVNTHPDLHTSQGTYNNPFTQDEYELIDVNPSDGNPTSRQITVRTDFLSNNRAGADGKVIVHSNGLRDTLVGTDRELCVKNIVKALPYDAPIFVCSMFILVKSLVKTGWVDVIATTMINMVGGLDQVGSVLGEKHPFVKPDYITIDYVLGTTTTPQTSTLFRLSFAFGFLSLLLCNLMNNQPSTILLSYVLLRCNIIVGNYQLGSNLLPTITSFDSSQPEIFPTDVVNTGIHPWYLKVMSYAVIAASNYSAIVTLVASLAGIIFANIVKTKLDGTTAELEEKIKNETDQTLKHDYLAEVNALTTQYISYTQFTSRGAYIIPFIYLSLSVVLVGAVFYA